MQIICDVNLLGKQFFGLHQHVRVVKISQKRLWIWNKQLYKTIDESGPNVTVTLWGVYVPAGCVYMNVNPKVGSLRCCLWPCHRSRACMSAMGRLWWKRLHSRASIHYSRCTVEGTWCVRVSFRLDVFASSSAEGTQRGQLDKKPVYKWVSELAFLLLSCSVIPST